MAFSLRHSLHFPEHLLLGTELKPVVPDKFGIEELELVMAHIVIQDLKKTFPYRLRHPLAWISFYSHISYPQ